MKHKGMKYGEANSSNCRVEYMKFLRACNRKDSPLGLADKFTTDKKDLFNMFVFEAEGNIKQCELLVKRQSAQITEAEVRGLD